MDPRETPFDGRVAHVSLKDKVAAERFVEGEAQQVRTVTLPILDQPGGERIRELVYGDAFTVLASGDGFAFGFSAKDGYVGHVELPCLGPFAPPSHVVAAARTYAKTAPHLKAGTGHEIFLPFGARLAVLGERDGWAEVAWRTGTDTAPTWIPARHLRALGDPFPDPAAVAELFLHTPYLWGGNSSFGIDCSGLVQAALLACGIPCPGDSDLQEARVGEALPPDAPLRRNDLVFWKGHVAIVLDEGHIIHANAHHMAVATEPLETARARIAGAGGGGVTSIRRPRGGFPPPPYGPPEDI